MEKLDKNAQIISDFIYDKPEVVATLLNKHGYYIDLDKTTLQEINQFTFEALYSEDMAFAQSLDLEIANEGYLGAVITAAIAVGSAIVSGIMSSNQAKKARELQKNIALSQMALTEKLSMEQIKAQSEGQRAQILLNSALEYRKLLQIESTARLKDTWIYVLGLGLSMGLFYGIYLISKK
jgi:hypothetical protein